VKGREAGSVRSQLAALAAGMAALGRRMEQLAAVHRDGGGEAAQIARLERLLDLDAVVAHARDAVARADLADDPAPHLLVADLLPSDAYRALLGAIPVPVLFEGRVEHGQEMRAPPRLAPMSSIVTWMFVDEIARALSDLLVARLAEPLAAFAGARFPSLPPLGDWGAAITVSEARLVRRAPGYAGRAPGERPWELITGIVDLARPQDSPEHGSRLGSRTIPFRANTALICIGGAEAHVYAPIPAGAPSQTERYTYEFGIGPTKAARRRLAALLGGAA